MKFPRTISMLVVFSAAMISGAVLLSGSEAHVINVTAKIESPMCDARSMGYWANNEGCSHGAGSSDWADEVHALSSQYSNAFGALTGGDMCAAEWMPNCPSGNTPAARRCRAVAHTLAVELNVVSHRLHASAFLAGTYDGDLAFYRLHLFESSTIQEALITLEAILADSLASLTELKDAAHAAERIYTFYESENPFHPRCVFDADDIPACRSSAKGDITIINENSASIINAVETGESESETAIKNEINTNVTDVGCGDCTPCDAPCDGSHEETAVTEPEEVSSGAIEENADAAPEAENAEIGNQPDNVVEDQPQSPSTQVENPEAPSPPPEESAPAPADLGRY